MHDIIIVGGGPAGLTAALYARRAGKSVLLLEKNAFGGQIAWSPKVENFPTISSISGLALSDRIVEQVMESGVELELDEVTGAQVTDDGIQLATAFGTEAKGKALIVATGAAPRMLGLANEESLIGVGVSYCAVCDGEFYKEKIVAVNGGGNTALQEALYLSDICQKVYLIHRRDVFRADEALVEAARARRNIEFVLNSQITGLTGEKSLSAITLTDARDVSKSLAVDGLFIAIGHKPENELFQGLIDLNEAGYAATGEDCLTKAPGIFVAGDCRQKEVRQLVTAMADGATAATAACHYLDTKK